MNVLVLGAGAFIGSHLVEYLVKHTDHQVVAVDVTQDKLAHVPASRYVYLEADAAGVTDDLIAKADVVVDLVAYANPSIYVEKPLEVFELNFETNLRVVRSCVQTRTRLIQYSTSEVYGKAPPGASEFVEDESDLILGPVAKQRWIYAAAKQLLERVIHAYGIRGDLDYAIIRPFNFIGPRMDHLVAPGSMGGPRVFAHFLSALMGNGPLYLVNGGTVRRTFLDIRDATTAFAAILGSDQQRMTYNVGNPANNVTIREFGELLANEYSTVTAKAIEPQFVDVDGETFYGKGYEDMDRVPPNVDRLRGLGWEPQYSLAETLRYAISDYLAE